jgi:hypothetical protein
MTRPVTLGRGGVRKTEGSTFAAHTTSHGRRVLTASVNDSSNRRTPAAGGDPSSRPHAPFSGD